jgi:PAS domain-containing protein
MWNTLAQGSAVTFEMRWKSSDPINNAAQWVLSACIPILNSNGSLISIAGETIDINAQKKSQEAAQARIESLEQARLSEIMFTRFAEISPIALYIFIPGIGMCSLRVLSEHMMLTLPAGMKFANDQFFELTGHSRTPFTQLEWISLVADEDVNAVEDDWRAVLQGKKSDNFQFRLKKTWTNQDGICSKIWIQTTSCPQFDEHGNITSTNPSSCTPSRFTNIRRYHGYASRRQQLQVG